MSHQNLETTLTNYLLIYEKQKLMQQTNSNQECNSKGHQKVLDKHTFHCLLLEQKGKLN